MRFACWINNVSDTFRIYKILLFHGHNGCRNAPLWHVISTIPVLLCLHVVRHLAIAIGLLRTLIVNTTMISTNPARTEVHLHFIQKFSDFVGKIIVFFVRVIRDKQIQSVGKKQRFWECHMAIHVVISGLYRVNTMAICSHILKNLHFFTL